MRFAYPVGSKIAQNEGVFNSMCVEFLGVADSSLCVSKKVYLVCAGSSGAIIATMLYFHLVNMNYALLGNNISIIHIKKDGERSHGSRCDGLPLVWERKALYIWIDDHVFGGGTLCMCHQVVMEWVSDEKFLFDWVVCLTSEYSMDREHQLEFFTNYTSNLVCNIDGWCEGKSGMIM